MVMLAPPGRPPFSHSKQHRGKASLKSSNLCPDKGHLNTMTFPTVTVADNSKPVRPDSAVSLYNNDLSTIIWSLIIDNVRPLPPRHPFKSHYG